MKRYLFLAILFFIFAFIVIGILLFVILKGERGIEIYNFGSKSLKKELFFNSYEINLIQANLKSFDIMFFPSSDERYCIKVFSSQKYIPEIKLDEKTLYITQTNKILPLFFILGSIGSRIEVYIPYSKYPIIKPNSESLKISINGISSDVSLNNIAIESLKLKTTSGDLRLNSCMITDTLNVASTSGDITGEANISKFKITSTSGDFSVKALESPKEDSSYSSVSGDFKIRLPEDLFGLTCNFTSVSGDYRNRFTETVAEKTVSDKYKSGTPSFDVKTVSGDCSILK